MLHRSEEIPYFDNSTMPSAPFIALRDASMAKIETDWGQTLVIFRGLTQEGVNHYQSVRALRRRFVNLSDEADELIGEIVANACLKKGGSGASLFEEDRGRAADFRELSVNGLLDVRWAGDEPYLYTLTNQALAYVEGTFPSREENMEINFSPTINAHAVSNAASSSSINASFSTTIASLLDLDIDDEVKDAAENALKELNKAAKSKDPAAFSDKLEKVASIAKSAATLANVILPFIPTAIQTLLC